MVPRKPKLIAAAAVIATGLLIAWPLRRSEELRPRVVPATISPHSAAADAVNEVHSAVNARQPLPATTVGLSGQTLDASFGHAGGAPGPVTVAKPVHDEPGSVAAFGLDNLSEIEGASPHDAIAAEERIHIVHPGDSLERLAKRYLGDEGRAIELFDLNRQVLENPHLLPIGAELRIPEPPSAVIAP